MNKHWNVGLRGRSLVRESIVLTNGRRSSRLQATLTPLLYHTVYLPRATAVHHRVELKVEHFFQTIALHPELGQHVVSLDLARSRNASMRLPEHRDLFPSLRQLLGVDPDASRGDILSNSSDLFSFSDHLVSFVFRQATLTSLHIVDSMSLEHPTKVHELGSSFPFHKIESLSIALEWSTGVLPLRVWRLLRFSVLPSLRLLHVFGASAPSSDSDSSNSSDSESEPTLSWEEALQGPPLTWSDLQRWIRVELGTVADIHVVSQDWEVLQGDEVCPECGMEGWEA